MASSYIIDAVDDLFKQLMETSHLFRGKIVIFGGGFRQILPVVPHGSRAQIIEVIAKKAECWPYVRTFNLTRNIRASRDERFAEWILNVGSGTEILTMINDVPKIHIPSFINKIAREIFGNYNQEIISDELTACRKVILCSTNEDV